MIYEPNTTVWGMGDLVIHDADGKTADMLMRVVSRDKKTGEYKTKYAFPEGKLKHLRSAIWRNDIDKLHDPARFNIKVPNV